MRSLFPAVGLALATLVAATPAVASDAATGLVVVTAYFGSRTSLEVSTELLQFDVTAPGQPATAAVLFSAGARTQSGGEVVLSLEPARGIDGPGGAADVASSLSFQGEGEGTMSGHVAGAKPTMAGRWTGSGFRQGRLLFLLRAGAAGTYTVPVHFVLSTP
jgi:hypothetical protein